MSSLRGTVPRLGVGSVPSGAVAALELLEGGVAQVGDQCLGGEHLAGEVGGTVRLAPAALGAAVEVEHVLPREMLEGRRAKVLIALVGSRHHGVDVDGTQTSPRLLLPEHDVGRGGDDVKVLAVAEVDEEPEDQDEVRPEEDPVERGERAAPGAEWCEEVAERRGHRPVGCQRLGGALGDEGREVELHADEKRRDPDQDEKGVAAVAAPEAGGADRQAVDEGEQHSGQREHAEEVLEVGERGGDEGNGVEPNTHHQRLDDPLSDGGEQDQETPEDQGVEHSRVGPAQQATLAEDVAHEGARPPWDVAAAPVGAP